MILVNQGVEALVDGLSNHLSPGDKLGVELVKDILEVVSLDALLGVEEFEEFLHEGGCNIDLETLDIASLIDDKLKEELVDALEMGPGGIDLLFLLDTSFREGKSTLLCAGERSEDVLLNHLHNLIKIGDDQLHHRLLFLQKPLEF